MKIGEELKREGKKGEKDSRALDVYNSYDEKAKRESVEPRRYTEINTRRCMGSPT